MLQIPKENLNESCPHVWWWHRFSIYKAKSNSDSALLTHLRPCTVNKIISHVKDKLKIDLAEEKI